MSKVIAEWWGSSPDDVNENDGLPPDPSVRIVLCEACGSEGTIYSGTGWDGDYLYADHCDYCEGTGGEIVTVTPITVEDLDQPST